MTPLYNAASTAAVAVGVLIIAVAAGFVALFGVVAWREFRRDWAMGRFQRRTTPRGFTASERRATIAALRKVRAMPDSLRLTEGQKRHIMEQGRR